MDYDKCTTAKKDKIIPLKEKRSEFRVLNRSRKQVKIVDVDNCLITDSDLKCDYIVEYKGTDDRDAAMFVELKGCGLDHAIKQLQSTLDLTKSRYKSFHKECYVVTTRFPKCGTTARRMKIDFFNKNKATLTLKNCKIEATI